MKRWKEYYCSKGVSWLFRLIGRRGRKLSKEEVEKNQCDSCRYYVIEDYVDVDKKSECKDFKSLGYDELVNREKEGKEEKREI